MFDRTSWLLIAIFILLMFMGIGVVWWTGKFKEERARLTPYPLPATTPGEYVSPQDSFGPQ